MRTRIIVRASIVDVERALVAMFPYVAKHQGGDLVLELKVERDDNAVYATAIVSGFVYRVGPWQVVDAGDEMCWQHAAVKVVMNRCVMAYGAHSRVGLARVRRGAWAVERRLRDARKTGGMFLWRVFCRIVDSGDRRVVTLSTQWDVDPIKSVLSELAHAIEEA